jgi:alpha-methylacyl-CoA racemase
VAEGQLAGVTVLDLSLVGPASRCTALLRDLGATVVKVLPPAGERPEPAYHAYGGGRGTRRLRLDLRAEGGRAAFLRLVRTADVVVESYRPGVADRLGFGYEACRQVNGAIVYAAVSGFGRDGPYANWAGHDIDYLAVGGFLSTQGRREDGGPAMPGATVADSAGGGMQAALAIAAALVRRGATGEGQFLDVSAAEGVLWLMSLFVDEYLATGVEAGPGTNLLTGRYACYDVYRARDGGWLAVGAIEEKFFANLCAALGLGHLADHQYHDDRQDEIRGAFRDAFATKDRDEWVAELSPKDTCVAPVLSIGDVVKDDHFERRGAFVPANHPEHGTFRQVAPVIAGAKRGDHAVELPTADPTDAKALLTEAGMPVNEIEDLFQTGVVG